MKFTAVGDALIQRRIPDSHKGIAGIKEWMDDAAFRYFNLETTLHREGECYGFTFNGGSFLRANPETLGDLFAYGFNTTTFCNNHTMDFAYEGLEKTLEHVEASGLVHSGVGLNLDQASAPAYLDTNEGRVALIGVSSSCNETYNDVAIAGKQGRRVKGRPGLNQLRVNEVLYVTKEQLETLKSIAGETGINAYDDIIRAEGYLPKLAEDSFDFGRGLHFKVGDKVRRSTFCNKTDLARIEKSIYEAKLVSDYIIVAIHSHQVGGASKETPAEFLEEFARFAIDKGADAVIGHGPHLLRPIEIYRGKPIFYSLGDFILQNENIPFAPEDAYESQGLTSDATMHDLFKNRSGGFTRGLQTQRVMFESVIPKWEIEDGKLTKLELVPIELGFGLSRATNGLPEITKNEAILERLAKMSEKYGTKMEIKDGVATVILD